MLHTYDFYLAGPFFATAQIFTCNLVKNKLQEHGGFSVCDPRELSPVIPFMKPEEKTPEFYQSVFAKNCVGIERSQTVFAILDKKDSGTIWELGYAYAQGKDIVTFTSKRKEMNVMLSQCANGHIDGVIELSQAVGVFTNLCADHERGKLPMRPKFSQALAQHKLAGVDE